MIEKRDSLAHFVGWRYRSYVARFHHTIAALSQKWENPPQKPRGASFVPNRIGAIGIMHGALC